HRAQLPAQELLRQGEARRLASGLRQAREVLRRQRLQSEAASACPYQQAFILRLQADLRVLRQGTQDVEQLSRTDGERARLARAREAAACADLDLDVGREKAERVRRAINEHVRQYRQRVAPLDDSAHRGKR